MADIHVEPVVEADEAPAPEERRGGSRSRMIVGILVAVVVLGLPLARPWISAYNYVLQVGLLILMWVAMASSWNIIGGFAGYISLGHNVFFGIGGYFSGLLLAYLGWSPFATALGAGVVAMAVGVLVGLITLRTRGPAFIISTIALLLLVHNAIDNWELAGAASGLSLPLPPLPVEWLKVPFYYGMAFCAFGAVGLAYWLAHSKFGLGLRALSQDETKAEVAGINTRMYKVTAYGLSAFFIGVAGALFGYSLSYLRPTTFFEIGLAAQMVLMSILGGRATVAGPVIGAVIITAVNEYSVVQFGATPLNIVVTGLILLATLLFFPLGIVGSLREAGRLPRWLDWDS
ncbi:MAG TPA: branched-chain amino acid ABC transporter permease [Acidimicrobiia bacterium]|jgi:branched-chain amino acid transport system permease protein